jgi:hypothetical protein
MTNETYATGDSRRLWLYVAACAAIVAAPALLGLSLDANALMHERGPVQLLQGAVLAAASAGTLYRLSRDGGSHRLAPLWVTAAFGLFLLAWREVELDMHYFQLHAFSWKYLLDEGRPVALKLIFGTVSIGSLVLMAGYLFAHRSRFVAGLFQRWPALLIALVAAGALTLVISQLWDKGELIHRYFGLAAFQSARLEPIQEEMLELLGELLLLLAVVELNILARRGHPALA